MLLMGLMLFLALAYGGYEVYQANGQILVLCAGAVVIFQSETLIGVYGHKLLKGLTPHGLLGINAVYGCYVQQREKTLALLAWTGLAGDEIACAEAEAAYLGDGDVYVLVAWQIVVAAEEAVAIGQHFKYAFAIAAFSALEKAGNCGIAGAVFFVVVALGTVWPAEAFLGLLLIGGLIALLLIALLVGGLLVALLGIVPVIRRLITLLGVVPVVCLIALLLITVLIVAVSLPLLIILLIGFAVLLLIAHLTGLLCLIRRYILRAGLCRSFVQNVAVPHVCFLSWLFCGLYWLPGCRDGGLWIRLGFELGSRRLSWLLHHGGYRSAVHYDVHKLVLAVFCK